MFNNVVTLRQIILKIIPFWQSHRKGGKPKAGKSITKAPEEKEKSAKAPKVKMHSISRMQIHPNLHEAVTKLHSEV